MRMNFLVTVCVAYYIGIYLCHIPGLYRAINADSVTAVELPERYRIPAFTEECRVCGNMDRVHLPANRIGEGCWCRGAYNRDKRPLKGSLVEQMLIDVDSDFSRRKGVRNRVPYPLCLGDLLTDSNITEYRT